MARREPRTYLASAKVREAWPDPAISGNAINGLGERAPRRASPFFWHPADQHPFGTLQAVASNGCRVNQAATDAFMAANAYPDLEPVNPDRVERTPEAWATLARDFAFKNEADLFGATAMRDHYIVEGYSVDEPNVIVLGIVHDYEELRQVTADHASGRGIVEVGRQYARGTRTSYALANWIRRQGYMAKPFPGPRASSLLLIPAAVDAGLGQLGKHGSLINRTYGSNLRLAGITTDMPLSFSAPDEFGSDDFCTKCQVCTDACPPSAISEEKQWVRGVERWYVDFDKCIPYFADNAGCAICIAVCPWARPGVADNLLMKMARRRAAGDAK
jgi:epoxyqueuosine reductase